MKLAPDNARSISIVAVLIVLVIVVWCAVDFGRSGLEKPLDWQRLTGCAR